MRSSSERQRAVAEEVIAPSVARLVAEQEIECVIKKVAPIFRRWRVQVSLAGFVYYDHRHWTKRSAKNAVVKQGLRLVGQLESLSSQ